MQHTCTCKPSFCLHLATPLLLPTMLELSQICSPHQATSTSQSDFPLLIQIQIFSHLPLYQQELANPSKRGTRYVHSARTTPVYPYASISPHLYLLLHIMSGGMPNLSVTFFFLLPHSSPTRRATRYSVKQRKTSSKACSNSSRVSSSAVSRKVYTLTEVQKHMLCSKCQSILSRKYERLICRIVFDSLNEKHPSTIPWSSLREAIWIIFKHLYSH